MTTYAFVLGRVYTLSLVEILEVLKASNIEFKLLELSTEIALISSPIDPNELKSFQDRLGGTIKIIHILDLVKKKPKDFVDFSLKNYFSPKNIKIYFQKRPTGKILIGVSLYKLDDTQKLLGQASRIGMSMKVSLKNFFPSSSLRLVLPKPPSTSLTSVTVKHNSLLDKGAEIVIIASRSEILLGRTLSIQNFEDYGRRDYSRPVRDEKRGMIPPKVAQIMINLARPQKNLLIYDPFCGLGTICQEAILSGFKSVGSDSDPKAILGFEKNLTWLSSRYKLPKKMFEAKVVPAEESNTFAQQLHEHKWPDIGAIVTEGFLGPIYRSLPSLSEMESNFQNLSNIYSKSFKAFTMYLKPKSRVVICFPAYRTQIGKYHTLPSLDFLTSIGYNLIQILPETLLKQKSFLQTTNRGTIIYDRNDQIVGREIVIFEKN